MKKEPNFIGKNVNIYNVNGRVQTGKVIEQTTRYLVLERDYSVDKNKSIIYINNMAVWYIYVVKKDETIQ